MIIEGACHCGNVAYTFERPGPAGPIDVRACGCRFCTLHGAVYTSHPGGALHARVRNPGAIRRYRFGTRTADFHVCAKCGVVAFVTCELQGRLYAVVNVNTFIGVDRAALHRSESDFRGETRAQRLARRRRNWIARVTISAAAMGPENGADEASGQ